MSIASTRLRGYLYAASAVLLVWSTELSAQEQFNIQVFTSARATADAHNTPATSQAGADRAAVSVRGQERSKCVDYGRASAGSATADILSREVLIGSASVQAAVSANASGGHYRTCVLCGGDSCIGVMGNDTTGRASASADAVFTIAFDADARVQPYELTLSNAGTLVNVASILEVRDEKGASLIKNSTGGRVALVGGPGKVYTVSAQISAAVSDKGNCCAAEGRGAAVLGIRLQRAPILESLAVFHPRIVGGNDVLEGQFKEVGALLQDGRPHCTATLIGEDLALTAAHCVYGRDVNLLSFALGTNAWKPQAKVEVAAYRFPKGEMGFRYDDKTLADDIAVLRLKQKPALSEGGGGLPSLHAGLPALSDVMDQKKALTFVGYGYRLVDNSPADRGIKRFVDIPIEQLQSGTFRNTFPGLNTCKGDSGGPAMFVRDNAGQRQWVVAGVTSGGDLACVEYGVNTRVDRYREWILQP